MKLSVLQQKMQKWVWACVLVEGCFGQLNDVVEVDDDMFVIVVGEFCVYLVFVVYVLLLK